MSIVTDFKSINSRLRGDDWWKPEVVAVEAPATVEREYVRPDLCKPLPVGGGSCGMTTAIEGRAVMAAKQREWEVLAAEIWRKMGEPRSVDAIKQLYEGNGLR